MANGFESDPHTQPGSECPRNKYGLTDYRLLQHLEGVAAAKRIGELDDLGVTGKFNLQHLCSIHRYVFQDVFPWAGELRQVDISKNGSLFGLAQFIHGALTDCSDKLKAKQLLNGLTPHDFAARAAFYLGEINAIHPFREGNGRTQREFIRQLALNAGHPLSWAGFTQQRMVDATILSHLQANHAMLESILFEALRSTRDAAQAGEQSA